MPSMIFDESIDVLSFLSSQQEHEMCSVVSVLWLQFSLLMDSNLKATNKFLTQFHRIQTISP